MTPLTVAVTGGASQSAYSLIFSVAKGDVFGKDQPIVLRLIDNMAMMSALDGVMMELLDCALPLLYKVDGTCFLHEAFQDADYAFLLANGPRRDGMEKTDVLRGNANFFKLQGQTMDQVCKKTVKVVVVGNSANTNACILSKYAPSIPKENFSSMTRLAQNRAAAQIGLRLHVNPAYVRNVIIWGRDDFSNLYPDVAHAFEGDDLVSKLVNDDNYLMNDFIKAVQTREAAVLEARNAASAMSAAKAACDHMRDWAKGTAEGNFVSMGVMSDGSYGIKKGLMYSFPVSISEERKWTIVQGLDISQFARKKMDHAANELEEELNIALRYCE